MRVKVYLKAILIICFSLTICLVSNAFAGDDSWEKIQAKGEIVVGFCAQYPPFEYKNDKGGFEGFDVDLGKALANQLGIKITFKDAEWQGLIAGMNKGDYDMLITCMGKNDARGANVNFTDVYFNLTEVIVVRKDDQSIKDKADLKGKKVGAQMATSSEVVLDGMADLVAEAKKYNYTTEAFLDLKFKRIDAVVCGMAYAIVQIKKDPSFKITGTPLNSTEIVMVLPKGAQSLTDKINGSLSSIKKDGTYKTIYDTWIKVD